MIWAGRNAPLVRYMIACKGIVLWSDVGLGILLVSWWILSHVQYTQRQFLWTFLLRNMTVRSTGKEGAEKWVQGRHWIYVVIYTMSLGIVYLRSILYKTITVHCVLIYHTIEKINAQPIYLIPTFIADLSHRIETKGSTKKHFSSKHRYITI